MLDTVELLIFLFCLLSGFGFFLHGLSKGQSLWEAFQPVALLFGLAGMTGSQVFLTGLAEGAVSLGCLIPGIAISLRHSRQSIARRHAHLLPDENPGDMSRGQMAVSKANLEDLEKDRARLRRRVTRVVAASSFPLLGVGALYHHWPSLVVGGMMLLTSGILGRWITNSPRDGSSLVLGADDGGSRPSETLPGPDLPDG